MSDSLFNKGKWHFLPVHFESLKHDKGKIHGIKPEMVKLKKTVHLEVAKYFCNVKDLDM